MHCFHLPALQPVGRTNFIRHRPTCHKKVKQLKINLENMSESCQNQFATTHRRQNMKSTCLLTANLAQIWATHCSNYNHSPPLPIATPSNSTAQAHLCSHPWCSVWTSRPTWSYCPQWEMKIDTTNTFENQSGRGSIITNTPQSSLISAQCQRRVYSCGCNYSGTHRNGGENNIAAKIPFTFFGFIVYRHRHSPFTF